MPDISLANLSLALGALMVLTAIVGLAKPEGAMDWVKKFPRNETAGWTLTLLGMACAGCPSKTSGGLGFREMRR